MLDRFLACKQDGILATNTGKEAIADSSYEVILLVYVETGRVCCKKTMVSVTTTGMHRNEHLIAPANIQEMVAFFGRTEVALALYRLLPASLQQPLLEVIPDVAER